MDIIECEEKTPEEIMERHIDLIYSKPFFEIEPTTVCNLNCTFCPRDKLTRTPGTMEIDTFGSIFDKIPSTSKVMFSGLGEPTLNPNLVVFTSALKKRGNIVGITTNGINLDASLIKKICELEVDLVQISIVAKDQKIYSSFMRGGDVNIAISNIETLLEKKNENMQICLSIIEGPGIPKDENIDSYAKSRGISVFYKAMHSRGGNLYSPATIQPKGVCGMFAKIVFITWNGDILACCQDMNGNTKLGNLLEDDLEDILERKERIIRAGKWFEVCDQCDDPYRFILFRDASILE